MSAEEFGATIEAYTYPPEFEECDGSASIATGVAIGQQARKVFGLSYRTIVGNDVDSNDHGYKLHLIYGALAAPSEKGYTTVNDSRKRLLYPGRSALPRSMLPDLNLRPLLSSTPPRLMLKNWLRWKKFSTEKIRPHRKPKTELILAFLFLMRL